MTAYFLLKKVILEERQLCFKTSGKTLMFIYENMYMEIIFSNCFIKFQDKIG